MKIGAALLVVFALAWFAAAANATENNLVSMAQIGDANTAEINQTAGDDSRANVTQIGAGNFAELTQAGGVEAVLLQNGAANAVSASQRDVSGDTRGWIYQTGTNHSANLTQDGADNSALLSQTGDSNVVDLAQFGDVNNATLVQSGVGLALMVTQTGGASISITQTGP